jgi:hypothetical protein
MGLRGPKKKLPKHDQHGPSASVNRDYAAGGCESFESQPEETPDAAKGTDLHARVQSSDYTDLSEMDADAVDWCREQILKLCGARAVFERHVTVLSGAKKPKVVTYGTLDVGEHLGLEGVVIDLKFGRNPVPPPESNIQIALYGEAWRQEHMLRQVTLVILQPFVTRKVKVAYVVAPEMRATGPSFWTQKAILTRWRTIRRRHLSTEPRLRASYRCGFCLHGATCPAAIRHASNLKLSASDGKLKSPARLGRIRSDIAQFERWAKQFKNYLSALMTNENVQVPGWVVQERSGKRRVRPGKVFPVVSDVIPRGPFDTLCKINVGDLEDAYARRYAKIHGTTIEAGIMMFRSVTNDVVEVADGSKVVVRASP